MTRKMWWTCYCACVVLAALVGESIKLDDVGPFSLVCFLFLGIGATALTQELK